MEQKTMNKIQTKNKITGKESTLLADTNGHRIEALAFKGFNADLRILIESQIQFENYLKSPEFRSTFNEDEDY